ncbi:MAG TPA: hypothetical protein VH092_32055, partial [Urbifossiella sp.]|nr:hypothetical protein [Urbifossiella sp.]
MASDLADQQAPAAVPATGAGGGGAARLAITCGSPVVAAGAALAAHFYLPEKQLPPLNWLETLPAWQHPYPVVLATIGIVGLLAAAVQAAFAPLRPAARHAAPLVAGATALLAVWEFVTVKMDWLHQPFFPGPDEVLGAMIDDRMILFESAWHSLQLLLAGYAVGATAGLVTGVLVGWFPAVRY